MNSNHNFSLKKTTLADYRKCLECDPKQEYQLGGCCSGPVGVDGEGGMGRLDLWEGESGGGIKRTCDLTGSRV